MPNSNNPLCSVLMTVYNREQYIATAIESVLAQSMDDFELIIVDDGSVDSSLYIARQYESDRRVKIFTNKTNLGDYPNRNHAASFASGKYLKYVDSDDAIYPHCLEVMIHMMEQHPEAGILLCAWSESDPFYPFELSSEQAYQRCFVHGERMSNSPLTTMYRKNIFDQMGGFKGDRWPLCSDWNMILNTVRCFPVLFAPTGFCFYRKHEGQIVSTISDSYLNHFAEGIQISFDVLRHPGCPLPKNQRKWAMGKLLKGVTLYTASLILKWRRPRVAMRFVKNCSDKFGEWINILRFDRPVKFIRDLNATPDWPDYPRATPPGAVKKRPENIKVGIVLTVTNTHSHLKSTIESILVQSLTEFELLVCVPDENLLQYDDDIQNCISDPRVKVLTIGDKINEMEIMNQGVREVRAEYVKFLRAGTLMYPWALEHILFPLYKKQAQLAVECAAGYLIYPVAIDFQNACRENFLRGGIFVMPPEAGCVKRDAFLKLGGFNVELDKAASHDMWLRLSLEGDTVLPVTGLTTAYKGWEHPVPQAFMNGILPKQYKKTLCRWLESASDKLESSLFEEIMTRLNMDKSELARTERPTRMVPSADWSLYPWSKRPMSSLR